MFNVHVGIFSGKTLPFDLLDIIVTFLLLTFINALYILFQENYYVTIPHDAAGGYASISLTFNKTSGAGTMFINNLLN